jgi:hypothetical protein
VAVVLLVAAVGLYFWRSKSAASSAPTPLPTVAGNAPSVEPPSNPKLDDVPPPLPPEDKPEAGPTNTRVVVAAPGGGCEGTCSLKNATPELQGALQVRAAQARRCYNSALASDSSLRGHVSVAVRIGPSGNVCSAAVASNDMGSPGVAQCAANIFRNASYPAPRGGCVDANVPMSFVPMGQ